MIRRLAFLSLAWCLPNVQCAEPNSSSKWKQSSGLVPRKDSFLPQPHVVQVEKYRYLQDERKLQESSHAGILEPVIDVDAPVTASSQSHDNEFETTSTINDVTSSNTTTNVRRWAIPTLFHEVDKLIFSTTLPLSAVFAIIPIASTLNLFWVNRLGDALAVAGQAAANQVYNSAFWLFAFLPTITATLVSKSHASGDINQTQDSVCQAMIFALMISVPGAMLMFFNPLRALGSILKDGSPALATALPYLQLRAFSFLPMMISFVGFSAFRGTMDISTAVKITMGTTLLSATLDPLLIHVFRFGVRGAAISTLCAEYTSAFIYLKLLLKKNLIRFDKLTKLPPWHTVAPLIKGSVALQIRSFAMNLTQLMVARVIQSIDNEGVAPAAHALALQTFQLGGILFGALGMATQTLVPSALAERSTKGDGSAKHATTTPLNTLVGRLLFWGFSLGLLVSCVQLFFLPNILSSSPLDEVRTAARLPALISISFQSINAVVSIGEGTMMGCGSFAWMTVNIITASLAYLATLQVFPQRYGLSGVWFSLATFTLVRLVGSLAFMITKLSSMKKHNVTS